MVQMSFLKECPNVILDNKISLVLRKEKEFGRRNSEDFFLLEIITDEVCKEFM